MSMRALVAIVIVLAAPGAYAEGELGPMIGGAIVGAHGDEVDVAGAGVEMALWYGPIGIGIEGNRQWTLDDSEGPQVTTVTGSLRVLAFQHVVPSFLDPKEVVDLGIELHGIVERGWWTESERDRDGYRYGLGAALRLRGASDDDHSNLLAESRVFVRVTRARAADREIAARGVLEQTEGTAVTIGLGAMWGGGRTEYVARLRRNSTLDAESIVR